MKRLLERLGANGHWVLPAGLVAGLLLPAAADPLKATIPWCIGLLLLISCLRINIQAIDLVSNLLRELGLVLVLQLLAPMFILGLAVALEWPLFVSIPAVLVAAAAPISGSPNLVILLGGAPALALRLLILGTAMMPITSIPVLGFLDPSLPVIAVLRSSLILLAVIVAALVLSGILRKLWPAIATTEYSLSLDGLAALVLAVVVIGLMSAIHDSWDNPRQLLSVLFLAVVVNVSLQSAGVLLSRMCRQPESITLGVIGGNRNVALYLTALPLSFTEPLLLFIACYQVPMYLTPLLGRYAYRTNSGSS